MTVCDNPWQCIREDAHPGNGRGCVHVASSGMWADAEDGGEE